jgi:hypothetical protein
MTRLEALRTVIEDPTRSDEDRQIAIRGLKRIAENGDHTERNEAKRILASLPLSQDEEDAKLIAAIDYDVPLAELRFPLPPAPWDKYEPRLKQLAALLCGDPALINLAVIANGGNFATACVSDLKALHGRTKSDRVRNAALTALTGIAKYIDDEDAKHDAQAFVDHVTAHISNPS